MQSSDVIEIARANGIDVLGPVRMNEMGLDFQVAFAHDAAGTQWVFRLPRRKGMAAQIDYEAKALRFLATRLPIAVPNWRVFNEDFIAYPLLKDLPILEFDGKTHEVQWNVNKDETALTPSLAGLLIELHEIPVQDAIDYGIKCTTVDEERQILNNEIQLVQSEIGLSHDKETRWRSWIDDDQYWPEFTVLVHGDFYPGHVLATPNGAITGAIDWSELRVSDSSIDFSGHVNAFGEKGLHELLAEYQKRGGRVWTKMAEHCLERSSASSLRYAAFALKNGMEQHIAAAKSLLLT